MRTAARRVSSRSGHNTCLANHAEIQAAQMMADRQTDRHRDREAERHKDIQTDRRIDDTVIDIDDRHTDNQNAVGYKCYADRQTG